MAYLYKVGVHSSTDRSSEIVTIADEDAGKSSLEVVRLPHSLMRQREELTIAGETYVFVPTWLLRKLEPTFTQAGKHLRTLSTKQAEQLAGQERVVAEG